jgi:hypothetical protein
MHVQHSAQLKFEAKQAFIGINMATLPRAQQYRPPPQQYQQQQYQPPPSQQMQRTPEPFDDEELTEKIKTSEVRKYHVNQQVSGMGDGHVSGFIHKIVPHSHVSNSGPGTLYIGLMPVPGTPSASSPYLDDEQIHLTTTMTAGDDDQLFMTGGQHEQRVAASDEHREERAMTAGDDDQLFMTGGQHEQQAATGGHAVR